MSYSLSDTQPRLRNRLGVHVYGFGAIALGFVGLAFDDFAAVWQPVPDGVPHRAAIAYLVAALFVLAGIAIQWRKTAPAAAILLGAFYTMSGLLWIPRVFLLPKVYGVYGGVFEQLSALPAALIIFAATASLSAAASTRLTRFARYLYAICVVSYALEHLTALKQTAEYVPAWVPPGQMFWAIATAVLFLLAAAAIFTGVQATLATRLLTVMILLFGLLVWVPMLHAHPHDHVIYAANAVTLALGGAAWVVSDWFAQNS